MPAKSMKEIATLLRNTQFKKRLIGGVDEDDVWRILEKLQGEYRTVVEAERERCAAKLEEREQVIDSLKRRLAQYEH